MTWPTPEPIDSSGAKDGLAARVRAINARLAAHYGPPPPLEPGDPLQELIGTILSQNTSDVNSGRALATLLERFGSFEAVHRAPVDEIQAAIRSGGLARLKAARIKQVLGRIAAERGEISLDFLRDLDLPTAWRYLTSLPGVGPKTAACVLLFACNRPALPVDTHVHRVSRRLGLIGPRTSAEQAHAELAAIVPAEEVYRFHMNLIRHGRAICRAIGPRCAICPVEDLCPKIGVVAPGA